MAGAGNIILNTARGPYRVRRQPRLFGQSQQERSGLQTANDVMATIQNASKIASMVAPFIKTDNPAAEKFNKEQAAKMAATQASEAQVEEQSEERLRLGATDFQQAQASMNNARQQNIKEKYRDMGTRVATQDVPTQDPLQRYMSAVDAVNNATTLEELQVAQVEAQQAQAGMSLPQPSERDPQFSAPSAFNQGMSLQNRPRLDSGMSMGQPNVGSEFDTTSFDKPLPPRQIAAPIDESTSIGNDLGGFTPPTPQELEAKKQAAIIEAQESVRFGTIVEAQAAMQAAANSGDLAAYNRASQAMLRSNMSDVRPQQWQDLITGGHYRRAQQGLMKAVPPPKGVSDLDRMRLKNMEDQIFDRGFKRVMSVTVEKRKGMIADMRKQMHDANLPGAVANSVIKRIEARMRPTKIKSDLKTQGSRRAANYARAAHTREETRFNKRTAHLRDAVRENSAITSLPSYKAEVAAQKALTDSATKTKDYERRQKLQDDREKGKDTRSSSRATKTGAGRAAQAEMNRLYRERRQSQARLARALSTMGSTSEYVKGKFFTNDDDAYTKSLANSAAEKELLEKLDADEKTLQAKIDDASVSLTDY